MTTNRIKLSNTQKAHLATTSEKTRAEISRTDLLFRFMAITEADKDFFSSYALDVRKESRTTK
jgi:hypothetical protein